MSEEIQQRSINEDIKWIDLVSERTEMIGPAAAKGLPTAQQKSDSKTHIVSDLSFSSVPAESPQGLGDYEAISRRYSAKIKYLHYMDTLQK